MTFAAPSIFCEDCYRLTAADDVERRPHETVLIAECRCGHVVLRVFPTLRSRARSHPPPSRRHPSIRRSLCGHRPNPASRESARRPTARHPQPIVQQRPLQFERRRRLGLKPPIDLRRRRQEDRHNRETAHGGVPVDGVRLGARNASAVTPMRIMLRCRPPSRPSPRSAARRRATQRASASCVSAASHRSPLRASSG